jgi:hypothetical protein
MRRESHRREERREREIRESDRTVKPITRRTKRKAVDRSVIIQIK